MENEHDLIGPVDAAELLQVTSDRIEVMVQEGLLTPVHGAGSTAWHFQRSEVLALNLAGG